VIRLTIPGYLLSSQDDVDRVLWCLPLRSMIDAERHALLTGTGAEAYIEEFSDVSVSGSLLAKDRPDFSALMSFVRTH